MTTTTGSTDNSSVTRTKLPTKTPCTRCGLIADALVHHATANGHPFTPIVDEAPTSVGTPE